MSAEWTPPETDAEFAAWMDNFVEKLPKYADQLGIKPEELAALQKIRAGFRAAFFREIQEELAGLRRRLKALRPEDHWPVALVEGFARLPITREPDRSALLRLMKQWIGGIERAHGGGVCPQLSWHYFSEGVHLDFTIPKPCEATSVFYRLKGRAAWKFLVTNTQPCKRLFTAPSYVEEDEERKAWLGKTVEFVACGWFENASFGFPSNPLAVVVPLNQETQQQA
jgi:hypothetical protein